MSAIPQVPEGVSRAPHVSHTNGVTASTDHRNGDTGPPASAVHEEAVENQRPIKVICIGAGFSGIHFGIRIPERIGNCELVIYEKNASIGGTWYENRYPGAACDVPAHSYQYTFNPKPDWPSVYSPAATILGYLESTAEKYGVNRFVKLRHEVKEAAWDQEAGKWFLQVQGPDGEVFQDSCDVLLSARGLLNQKKWPAVEGLWDFQGPVMHSAAWNEDYDFRNKRIGVVGLGSSAIQIIPRLQKMTGTHLDCFIRGKTWITPPFGEKAMQELGFGGTLDFPPDQIARFKQEPEELLKIRMKFESDGNSVHAMMKKGTPEQKQMQAFTEQGMKERLAKRPEIFEMLKPSFSPGCRRITPGPGFLEALMEDNVSIVRSDIARIEPKGVVTADGKLHEIDALVCATGFYTTVAPPFPVKGLNGLSMQKHWEERAHAYLSLATSQFPNFFLVAGPNSGIADGSATAMIESVGMYIVKAIRKIQKENIKSMVVKAESERDFVELADEYFKGTVFADDCKSWYRQNGRGESADKITGIWPGSTLHCMETLRSPRWEDFDYEFIPEKNGARPNRLAWLGNGNVMAYGDDDKDPQRRREKLAWYILPMMQEREIGLPVSPHPEENPQFVLRPWSY